MRIDSGSVQLSQSYVPIAAGPVSVRGSLSEYTIWNNLSQFETIYVGDQAQNAVTEGNASLGVERKEPWPNA